MRDRIVLFLSPSSGPCHMLGDEVLAAREDGFEFLDTELVLVTDEFGAAFYRALRADEVLVSPAEQVARRLGVRIAPWGVAVDAGGVVRWAGAATDFDDIVAMVAALAIAAL